MTAKAARGQAVVAVLRPRCQGTKLNHRIKFGQVLAECDVAHPGILLLFTKPTEATNLP